MYILLFISLLGQFLLTPAMAMPDMLYSLSQQHSQGAVQSNISRVSHSSIDSLYAQQSDFVANNGSFDCEALCQELASGHCKTHGGCSVGLHNDAIFVSPNSRLHARIIAPTWSIKTVTLHIVNPPPIA